MTHQPEEEPLSGPTPELPELEAQKLRELRQAGPDALPRLRARVAVLRDAGWSLTAVGKPLSANRSTTRMWQMSAQPEHVEQSKQELGLPPRPPLRRSSVKVVRLYPDVPEDERFELTRLAASARRVRGWTPPDAQARLDAAAFEKKVREYVARGVPVKRIAERVGITHHAVSARLGRADEKLKKAS